MKNVIVKAVLFCLFVGFLVVGNIFWNWSISPEASTQLGLNQVNGDNMDAVALRTYTGFSGLYISIGCILSLIVFLLLFWSNFKYLIKFLNTAYFLILIIPFSYGCRKPYDVPKYEQIDTNETAFVIPLEGETAKQVAFDSADQLNRHKVAAKRIQVTHRWNQTGRWGHTGEWIDSIRVIKVSRTPTTREWTAEKTGTASSDQAIWAESSDSVGFSTGITCTSLVMEDNTALFLYSYNGQSLAQVMDSEVRARVQAKMAEFSAGFTMDTLRDQKVQMMNFIRDDVIPFFIKKGISITTLGQFGGFTYENPEIQKAIDSVFMAQQEKNVANALLTAQKDKNQKLKEEGMGEADKTREIAKGKKDAAITEAEGKAKAIDMVADATKRAEGNPMFLEIRKLEVQQEQIKQWDGKYPIYMMNLDSSPNMLMAVPAPPLVEKK
jgi:hypothetical protein